MDHFQLRQQHGVPLLVCEPLARAGFIHGFSTRQGGTSALPERALNLGYFKGDAPEQVRENRRRFLHALDAAAMKLITAKQIHSDRVIVIRRAEEAPAKPPSQGDALITNEPNLLLGVQTADCVPILVADPERRAAAAIHAGWRGTLARLVQKTLARMQAEFGTRPEDCLAAISPAAGGCCYEIGRDVLEPFRSEFGWAGSFISHHQSNGKAHLDLPACTVQQLMRAGLSETRIFASGFCTLCRNDLFFSHRLERHRGVGRLMSVIGLR